MIAAAYQQAGEYKSRYKMFFHNKEIKTIITTSQKINKLSEYETILPVWGMQ
jgi:hypothetical protein